MLPGVGLACSLWLWTSLSSDALVFGLGWLAAGLVWLVILTRGFRRPPPQMEG